MKRIYDRANELMKERYDEELRSRQIECLADAIDEAIHKAHWGHMEFDQYPTYEADMIKEARDRGEERDNGEDE